MEIVFDLQGRNGLFSSPMDFLLFVILPYVSVREMPL